ncbi:MAG: hypothetical protein AB1566_02585 [Chloroflexota bacterium]
MNKSGLWCAGCGVEITWSPMFYRRRAYCCSDCLARGDCRCDYQDDAAYPSRESLRSLPLSKVGALAEGDDRALSGAIATAERGEG